MGVSLLEPGTPFLEPPKGRAWPHFQRQAGCCDNKLPGPLRSPWLPTAGAELVCRQGLQAALVARDMQVLPALIPGTASGPPGRAGCKGLSDAGIDLSCSKPPSFDPVA